MFIDIHVHARTRVAMVRNGKQAYIRDSDLIKRMDALGIEKAVLQLGLSSEFAVQPQTNDEVLDIYERWPDRIIPFCNVDPRAINNSPSAPLDEIIAFYKKQGCKGVGEVTANLAFDNPMVENLFKCCEKLEMPLTFHVSSDMSKYYGLFDLPGLPLLEGALQKFPDLIFLAHSQTFWAEIATLKENDNRSGYPKGEIKTEGVVPKLMRKYKNLCGDLSAGSGYNAISRDEEFGVRFLEEFQDKLFFGTDIAMADDPEPQPTPIIPYLLNLREKGKISEKCFQKISRENAVRLFKL